jgi:hypothetical protein
MELAKHLAPSCRYQPADIVARSPDCIVVDLNREGFPTSDCDAVTMLGVLEYVCDPNAILKAARSRHSLMILSYVTHCAGSIQARREMGWFNDFTRRSLEAVLDQCGWNVRSVTSIKRRWRTAEYLFALT